MAKEVLLALAILAHAAAAEEEGNMAVALDHAEMIRLPAAAARVIVGNPALADVTVDSPRLISVFGKAPGETSLIVLGAHDRLLLSRVVIVSAGGIAVHVPGKDGPVERSYSCADGRCRLIPARAPATAPVPKPAPPTQ